MATLSKPTEPAQADPMTGSSPVRSGFDRIVADGITFDDVLLIPQRSEVLPSDADTGDAADGGASAEHPAGFAPRWTR
jgi:hypothetical protein